MGLHWNIESVEDCDTLCFDPILDAERKPTFDSDGKPCRGLKIETETLIFMTMSLGMRGITEKNWKEFFTRMDAWEKLFGAILTSLDENGKRVPHPFTEEQIKAHIGLSTNASPLSDTQFRNHIWKTFTREH